MAEALERQHVAEQLESINQALGSGMYVHVRKMLQHMAPADVALLLEASPIKSRAVLWQLLDPDFHGDVLEELSEDVRNGIIRTMVPDKLAEALEDMDTDDLAELLNGLPDKVVQDVLRRMDTQDRVRAEQALSYGEGTAGFIMNTDTITLRPEVTIDVILRYLRLKREIPEGTDTLYVTNRHDKLIGTISLPRLLTSAPDSTVDEVMDEEPLTIPVDMVEGEIAKLFERHNWISAPVVNESGILVGRITIDDVVDIIREDAEHSMMSMAGLDDEEDTFAPVVKSTKRRSVWLGVNLITAIMAAAVSNMFEEILSQLAVLAILNTIVPSMGGVAGNQTLTLVIRGMALGHVGSANSRWLVGKELAIGLLNGLMWALLIASVVAIWKQDLTLGIIIAFAMLINMVVAGLAGAVLPLAMKKVNIDPALAGSVILTTVTDIVGIFAFLGTATIFLV
ncbi:magnesium transporter [Paraneptunicella aestuarii]|uniref:magnesium transporter n=1 Tax=Paraneptunicella aestuarii TaxID=2831148 RepID=UPI001E3C2BCD|nr:magnesium transporter [Paraneptunicella aestuarii]UAA38464.1 magnesium transporter [Paraneptunicella aestuarii]